MKYSEKIKKIIEEINLELSKNEKEVDIISNEIDDLDLDTEEDQLDIKFKELKKLQDSVTNHIVFKEKLEALFSEMEYENF